MRYNKRLGIALFAVLVAVAVISSFFITPLSVSDSDPSTYVVVPLLMLPLFAVFMAKERMRPDVRRRDLVLGVLLFAALVLLTAALRFELSYLFLGYRIDMLLFPLLLLSIASLLFGGANLRKFKYMAVYSLLASSLLMAPFIESNQGFAVFNTIAIYSVAKAFIHNLTYIAPITLSAGGYQIGIGQTCVGVGVLIGIVLFLLPVAYLYEGSRARKALWLASGFALLLVLNMLRMLSIALVWLTGGPSNALLEVHVFAGILLFYLTIIVMMLLSGRYGLGIGSSKKGKALSGARGHYAAGAAIAVAVALAYLALTYNYSTSVYISQAYLGNGVAAQFTNSSMDSLLNSAIDFSGFNATAGLQGGNGAAALVWGGGIPKSAPLIAYVTSPNGSIDASLMENNRLVGRLYMIDDRGLSGTVYDLESNGTYFLVYRTAVPYLGGGGASYARLEAYLILPSNESGSPGCGSYDALYFYILNAANPAMYNQQLRQSMLGGYCTFDRLVR